MGLSTGSYRIKKKLMSDTFEVPRRLISALSEAGETEIKVFLTLASLEGEEEYFTDEELTASLEKAGAGTDGISEALAFLRGAGLMETPSSTERKTAKKSEPRPRAVSSKPSYTSKELAAAANKGEFRDLVEYASRRLAKTFNTSELSTLYSFTDHLCLPSDVVMLAIEHCVSEGKGSLRYVEKLLSDFADREINTYQKAEDYIVRRREYLSFEGEIRRMMGLGQRSLTSKEKAMLSSLQEWSMPDELLKLAYDKTVEKTGRASMSYMYKIIESWHTAGFKTVSEVESGDRRPQDPSGFDPEEFFREAVAKNKK